MGIIQGLYSLIPYWNITPIFTPVKHTAFHFLFHSPHRRPVYSLNSSLLAPINLKALDSLSSQLAGVTFVIGLGLGTL